MTSTYESLIWLQKPFGKTDDKNNNRNKMKFWIPSKKKIHDISILLFAHLQLFSHREELFSSFNLIATTESKSITST